MAESCLMLCAWSSHLERGRRGLREFSWFSRSRQVTQRQSEGTPCRSKGRSRRVSVAKLRLTKNAQCRLLVAVSTLRHIVALVLLALWLPTTQHCGLEAAGLIAAEAPHGADSKCCETGDSHCTHDGCNVVESSLIKSSSDTIKVPTPALAACTCFLCLQLLRPVVAVEPIFAVTASESPEHWVAVWQFVRRAAPLSRAPSLVG